MLGDKLQNNIFATLGDNADFGYANLEIWASDTFLCQNGHRGRWGTFLSAQNGFDIEWNERGNLFYASQNLMPNEAKEVSSSDVFVGLNCRGRKLYSYIRVHKQKRKK